MNLRQLAAKVLVSVIKDGQSLTSALDSHIPNDLEPQGKAFVQALCYGVCRYYHQLQFVLSQLLNKPLKNKDCDINALMLAGLYQLQFMRVKPHAAVSETVAAARKKAWAKSLINAVLRQFQRRQQEFEILEQHSPGAFYSHPDWMIEAIGQDWPQYSRSILTANNQAAPMVIRVNVQRTTTDDYLRLLEENGLVGEKLQHCDTAIELQQAVPVDKLPGFFKGLVSVQDLAAQLAAHILNAQPGDKVADLCAAPGGKTAAVLERQAELSTLYAVDVDGERLQKIEDNLQRLGLQAELQQADASQPGAWSEGKLFDKILLDAPCSALGVIRRHPDIKILRRDSDIPVLAETQRKMLSLAWQLLAPGGVLLYATCSVLKQENEQQIEDFLQTHEDAVEIKIAGDWGVERPFGRQSLMLDGKMDGFYYAKLQKVV